MIRPRLFVVSLLFLFFFLFLFFLFSVVVVISFFFLIFFFFFFMALSHRIGSLLAVERLGVLPLRGLFSFQLFPTKPHYIPAAKNTTYEAHYPLTQGTLQYLR